MSDILLSAAYWSIVSYISGATEFIPVKKLTPRATIAIIEKNLDWVFFTVLRASVMRTLLKFIVLSPFEPFNGYGMVIDCNLNYLA